MSVEWNVVNTRSMLMGEYETRDAAQARVDELSADGGWYRIVPAPGSAASQAAIDELISKRGPLVDLDDSGNVIERSSLDDVPLYATPEHECPVCGHDDLDIDPPFARCDECGWEGRAR